MAMRQTAPNSYFNRVPTLADEFNRDLGVVEFNGVPVTVKLRSPKGICLQARHESAWFPRKALEIVRRYGKEVSVQLANWCSAEGATAFLAEIARMMEPTVA